MKEKYTAIEIEMIKASIEFREAQIKRAINSEKNDAVKKLREKELQELQALKATF